MAAGYVAFFALLFLPLPLRGDLPGNCDTWLNGIALPNHMLNRILAAWSGDETGATLYPATGVFGFGESAFGTSFLFILFKLVARDDIVSYYLFVTTIMALNAFGVYCLARLYVRDPLAAAFTGLAFSASNYALGNIDSPHTSFFFVAFLSLYHWKRYLEHGERRSVLLAAVLGGAQVYFSAYVFLFQSLAAAALFMVDRLRGAARARLEPKVMASAFALFGLVATPFFAFYAGARAGPNFANPWDPHFLAEVHSLDPADLLRTLENNLLYPFDRRIVAGDVARRAQDMMESGLVRLRDLTNEDSLTVLGRMSSPDDVKYFVYTRRCAFLGFVLYALAGAGLIADRRIRWELGVLYIGALLVSFGPLIAIGSQVVFNPLFPVHPWLDVTGVLRVPSRAFSFSALAVVLAAGVGMDRLAALPALRPTLRRSVVLGLFTLAVLAENVPVPLKTFAGRRLAVPEPLVRTHFEGRRGHVLLDLPSRPGGALYHDQFDLFEWNRELVYMNRQTYHRQHIVNGVHGYFPRTRLQVQRLIDALPDPAAFAGLRWFGVDRIVYHRTLELPWEAGLYDRLARSGELEVVDSSPEVTIFGWASLEKEDR